MVAARATRSLSARSRTLLVRLIGAASIGVVGGLLAALFLLGGLWVAWATRQTILNDFSQRLSEASSAFAANLHSEYETAIGTLLAEYAASLKPIRAHIKREKDALTPLTRRWQELFLGFKALAQDL